MHHHCDDSSFLRQKKRSHTRNKCIFILNQKISLNYRLNQEINFLRKSFKIFLDIYIYIYIYVNVCAD